MDQLWFKTIINYSEMSFVIKTGLSRSKSLPASIKTKFSGEALETLYCAVQKEKWGEWQSPVSLFCFFAVVVLIFCVSSYEKKCWTHNTWTKYSETFLCLLKSVSDVYFCIKSECDDGNSGHLASSSSSSSRLF